MIPWLVLVNPYASRARNACSRVENALEARGIAADVVEVDGFAALRDTVSKAVAEQRDRFVAVGGDGSVNAVLNEILSHDWDSPPILGVLPAGTGCDLLRTFGIEDQIESAVDHLAGTPCIRWMSA